jgi:peptidoglycan-associated lipoprotein
MTTINNIKTIMAIGAFCAILAGCTQSSRSIFSSPGEVGVTDEPAAGFAEIIPGSEEHYIITVGRRVYFAAKSSKLDDVAIETLDIQAAWLTAYPQWLIKLQGHADDLKKLDNNTALSVKRAKVVMDYLSQKGIQPNRMWTKGYGSERLVRNCIEFECKALNRRVVVNLRKKFDAAAPQFKQVRS